MKTPAWVLALALIAAPWVRADLPDASHGKLDVVFQNWQHFTDIKDYYQPTDKGELAILGELKQSLEEDAKYDVPAGDHLSLVFTDIDLAGDFEPGRGADWDQVRIVKDVYPPRFQFSYQLTGASGGVLKHGTENLTDLAFTMRTTIHPDDRLHFEKDILREWMDNKIRSR